MKKLLAKFGKELMFFSFVFIFVLVFAIQFLGTNATLAGYGYGHYFSYGYGLVFNDRIVNTKTPASTIYCSGYGDIGVRNDSGTQTISRYYSQVDLSKVDKRFTMSKAILYIDRANASSDRDNNYVLYKTGYWNMNSVTWDSQPTIDWANPISGSFGSNGLFAFDITRFVKEWLANPSANYGVLIQKADESAYVNSYGSFVCSSYSPNGSETRPTLKLVYESPDLIVNSLRYHVEADGTKYLNWDILNIGAAIPRSTAIRAKAIDLDTGIEYLSGSFNTNTTIINNSLLLSSNIPIKTNSNQIRFKATVDYENLINEINESNNTIERVLAVPVPTTQQQDLSVVDIRMSAAGNMISLFARSTIAYDGPIEYKVEGLDSYSNKIWSTNVNILPLQDKEMVIRDLLSRPLPTGSYRIKITFDPNNKISESNDNNNVFEKTISVSAPTTVKPDLTVGDVRIVNNNGANYFEFLISNTGNTATKEGQMISLKAVDLDTNATYSAGYSNDFYGSTYVLSSSKVSPKASGIYRMRVTIDDIKLIDESNESNNVLEKTITVPASATVKPDLVVTDLKIDRLAPWDAEDMKYIYVTYVNNGGDGGSGKKVVVKVTDLTNNEEYEMAVETNSLLSGDKTTLAVNRPLKNLYSTHKFRAQIDPGKLIDESNEGNNVFEKTITVSNPVMTKPDLTVTSIGFSPAQKNVNGTLSVTVKNLGADLVDTTGLYSWYNNFSSQNFIFSAETPSITAFKTDKVIPATGSPLKNNESITFSWIGKFNYSGDLYIHFTVNNGNQLVEADTKNNSLSGIISIQDDEATELPDLVITRVETITEDKTIDDIDYVLVNFWIKYKNIGAKLNDGSFLFGVKSDPTKQYPGGFLGGESVSSQFIEPNTEYDTPLLGSYLLPKGESLNANFKFGIDYVFEDPNNPSYAVNNSNKIAESNENNNIFEKTIRVSSTGVTNAEDGKSDYIVKELGIKRFTGGNTGDYYYAIVENIGEGLLCQENPCQIGLLFEGQDGWLGDVNHAYYEKATFYQVPSAEKTRRIEFKGPSINQAKSGLYEVKATVNPYHDASGSDYKGEMNYNNNSLTKKLAVRNAGQDDYNNNANRLSNNKLDEILVEIKQLRNLVKEQENKIKYLEKLTDNVKNLSDKMEDALNQFITYGVDDNTQKLGAGERAAVISSYKSAFSKLPETEAELADAIKIANGRWPSTKNDKAEKRAKEQFQKIYKRIPDMNNAQDNAAVTVMAYGLRQKADNRNLESEEQGIKTFKNIYGKNPSTTDDWNIMQSITYSGATRGVDTDGDLLVDDREKELGTDPNNKDTDGDKYLDGIEVANGYDPLKKGEKKK